ncbi:HLH DNA binding domain protein [Aspergillus californicus]
MSIDMATMAGDDSPHYFLPGVRSISCTSSPTDMTEDRRLPPLPRIEPIQRDLFNQYTHRSFMASPPSTYEFTVKSPWPPVEHVVAPPSPASSAYSWTESMLPQRVPIAKLSTEDLIKLIAPDPKSITRKMPFQQPCGRKRKGSMISGDSDDQREKHRVAEGNRRKGQSSRLQQIDIRLHDHFLEQAGWDPLKSLPESKEHILQGAIELIDFQRCIILLLICKENELPHHLQDKMQPQFRCMQLQRFNSSLQQQNQTAQQQINALKQDKQALEERIQALEYQSSTREPIFRSPKSEQRSPQQVVSLPDSKPKAMLPGLNVFCGGMASDSPESPRLDALPSGTSQSFGHTFLRHTPPMTGPSSPVFHQATYSVTDSRLPSLIQSP